MASHLWNPLPSVIMDGSGNIAASAKAYFYYDGTSQPLTVYSDYGRTTPHSWPVEANSNGVVSPIYLPFEDYRVRLTTADDALIFYADGVSNPAPASGGGGGGIVVSQTDIWNTGDIMFNFSSSKTGWVRMNDRTIGS